MRSLAAAMGMVLVISASRAQTLQLAVDASPTSLDPHLATTFISSMVCNGTIYEGLTTIDRDLHVAPCLAASWSVATDGKTYTFHLVPQATFHDGVTMTAADVVATINRVKSKAMASPLSSRLESVESAKSIDPQTVELKLAEPCAPLLASLANIPIVSKTMENNRDALRRKPNGTGPFKFKEWQPNGYLLLVRNDQYWGEKAKLDGLKFNIVPEAATRQIGLLSGQFSMLPDADPATALQLKGKPGIKTSEVLELSYTLIGMNTAKPPFSNPKVREALNYALNRGEIIQAALFGAGVPAGPLSPALQAWATDVSRFPNYKPDAAKARALLKEAGLPLPVTVTMKVLPRQDLEDIAQVAQEELNRAGFNVQLNVQEPGQFDQDWRNSNFDLFVSANAGAADPDDYFYRTFHTGGSTNVFKYSDQTIDNLLDLARSSLDAKERKAAYDQVQAILASNGPAAHIAYATLFTVMRDNVRGFETMPNRSLMMLKHTSLAK